MNLKIKRITGKTRIKLFANTPNKAAQQPPAAAKGNSSELSQQRLQLAQQKIPMAQQRLQVSQQNVSVKQAATSGANMRSQNAIRGRQLNYAARQLGEKNKNLNRLSNVMLANKTKNTINVKTTIPPTAPSPSQTIKSMGKTLFNFAKKR